MELAEIGERGRDFLAYYSQGWTESLVNASKVTVGTSAFVGCGICGSVVAWGMLSSLAPFGGIAGAVVGTFFAVTADKVQRRSMVSRFLCAWSRVCAAATLAICKKTGHALQRLYTRYRGLDDDADRGIFDIPEIQRNTGKLLTNINNVIADTEVNFKTFAKFLTFGAAFSDDEDQLTRQQRRRERQRGVTYGPVAPKKYLNAPDPPQERRPYRQPAMGPRGVAPMVTPVPARRSVVEPPPLPTTRQPTFRGFRYQQPGGVAIEQQPPAPLFQLPRVFDEFRPGTWWRRDSQRRDSQNHPRRRGRLAARLKKSLSFLRRPAAEPVVVHREPDVSTVLAVTIPVVALLAAHYADQIHLLIDLILRVASAAYNAAMLEVSTALAKAGLA